MPHPDTDALVERIFKNPKDREDLYRHAARFFDRSTSQQRAGLDAADLVSEAIERVLKAGTLHDQPNPKKYILRTIINLGINAKERHGRYQQKAPTLVDPKEIAPTGHDATTAERLAAESVVKEAMSALPERAKRVAQAKLNHPNKTINELAEHLGVSRDTIRRAIQDMRNNETLRDFFQLDAESPPTANELPPEENP